MNDWTLPSAARCGCTWPTSTSTAPASSSAKNLTRGNHPQADLAAAEKLINDCGYHRRDQELADAKRAILGL